MQETKFKLKILSDLYIKSVAEQKANLSEKLKIFTVSDLGTQGSTRYKKLEWKNLNK
nr:hypothetical protein [Mycoplasmopsis bovis]QQH18985.1 hypothetical protein HYE48_00885 [Mycoplasmopsis bovis]